MPVTLADMILDLQATVPAADGNPSELQYSYAVKQGVADYSSRVGMRKRAIITVASGTAGYSLPDDFIRAIKLESAYTGSTLINGTDLIPFNSGAAAEQYNIAGSTITFYPTPNYSGDRVLWYQAAYTKDSAEIYQDLTDEIAEIILIKAQAILWGMRAGTLSQEGIKMIIGDVTIDRSGLPLSYAARASALNQQYDEALASRAGLRAFITGIRPGGAMRPSFDWND